MPHGSNIAGFVGCSTGCFFRFLSFFCISLTWAWSFGMKVFANKFHFNIGSFQCFSDFFLPLSRECFSGESVNPVLTRSHKISLTVHLFHQMKWPWKKNYTCHYSNSPAKSQHPPIPRKTWHSSKDKQRFRHRCKTWLTKRWVQNLANLRDFPHDLVGSPAYCFHKTGVFQHKVDFLT